MFPCGSVDAFDGDNSDVSLGCGYALPFPNAAIIKYVVACPGYGIGVSYLPNQTCATFFPEQNAPPPTPTCEQTETAFVSSYLSKYNSPLAAYAGWIVTQSDLYGIDDRFIVALAGAESIYGKTQQNSPTWGYYNAFSNAAHCIALNPAPCPNHSDCYAINPYGNYGQAITDAVDLLTGSKYFGKGLVTVGAIYKKYNRVPAGDYLATIYAQLVPNATVNNSVDFSRCP